MILTIQPQNPHLVKFVSLSFMSWGSNRQTESHPSTCSSFSIRKPGQALVVSLWPKAHAVAEVNLIHCHGNQPWAWRSDHPQNFIHSPLLPTPPAFLKSLHPCIYKVINETFRAFWVGQLHCVFKREEDRAEERQKESKRMEDKCKEGEQIDEWARNAPPAESS